MHTTPIPGVFFWWNGTVEWNSGMEWWNGLLEWNSGMATLTKCCSVSIMGCHVESMIHWHSSDHGALLVLCPAPSPLPPNARFLR